jgi:ribose 5-phosphate isomerase B
MGEPNLTLDPAMPRPDSRIEALAFAGRPSQKETAMRVHIGSDHAGFEAKQRLASSLAARGYEVVDHGPVEYDAQDDYPPFCLATAAGVVSDPGSLGVVLGGSGNGEQMAANKVVGVRAALVWSEEIARLAREHNDANVASIGARMHEDDEVLRFIVTFLETPFSGDDRHTRRIKQLAEYERTRQLPPLR